MNAMTIKNMTIKKNSVAAAVTASALLLSACGSGSPDAEAEENGGLEQETIVVGTQPFAELAPLHIAIEQGIFEENGLTVELADATGGGAGLIPGMVAGDIDVVYSNYVSLLQGAAKGLPLQVVRENDRPGVQALYVMPGSGITEPQDLSGKTIAINGLGNIMELTSRAVLESHGVTDAEFVEIPPPNMEAALANGQVDAAWLVEPFVTTATENLGATPVVSAFEGPTEDLPVAGWAVREDFAGENPNTVEAFVGSMDEAIAVAEEDPEAVKEALLSYTQIPEDVVGKLSPISFAETSDFSHLGKLNEIMVEQGLIEQPVDLDTFIADVQ
ncbi:ABC transporter substrate-binding protein [Kocuria rosea]|uniref:ABC transporter substrate-binding protein n=1 Tax=Kocuria rosea TaxID=1275 RepID=UPI00203CFA04|nr:ABC transporter substrate-binding protein [Kocuria rosea]